MIESCSIAGTGMAAGALAPALSEIGVKVVSVTGRDPVRVETLARNLGSKPASLRATDLTADLVVVCVPDFAISEVCGLVFDRRDGSGCIVVHLAGALGVEPLSGAAESGARVGVLHPIASLAGGAARLRQVAWGIDGDDDVVAELRDLVHRLRGFPIDLRRVDRPLYHLAAVFASNFLLTAADAAVRLWELSGAPAPAIEALKPLADGTLANWSELGIDGALTGPIARGDVAAVERQLHILALRAPELEPIFRELGVAAAAIAQRVAGPDDPRIAEIGRFLARREMVD